MTQQLPTWVRRTITKLENLPALQENWDSYGARPIDMRSIQKAHELICELALYVGINEPAVSATPDGHVGLSWDEGSWSIDAEMLPDGRIRYVYLDERDSANDRERVTCGRYELLGLLTQAPESV